MQTEPPARPKLSLFKKTEPRGPATPPPPAPEPGSSAQSDIGRAAR